jgi:glycosyltransferase involved in cell wall biosynthesis
MMVSLDEEKAPFLSIVIPVYNQEVYIEECLNSIFA